MPTDPLFEVRWKEYEAALDEARSRRDVEREEWFRKIDKEQLEFSEWSRKRDVVLDNRLDFCVI